MNNKIIATRPITNNLSINIIDIDYGINDKVTSIIGGKKHTNIIHFNGKGLPYITIYRQRYYLNEFIKL